MARYKDIDSFVASLNSKIRKQLPNIVAETATEFFKARFQSKEWDGFAWPQTKKIVRKGSLLVRSSKLVNSIRPSLVTADRVRISAGNAKVPYAKIHNDGGIINHPGGTAFMQLKKEKRFAWVSNKKAAGTNLPRTRPHQIPIPRRQFMEHSPRLNAKIYERIVGIINQ